MDNLSSEHILLFSITKSAIRNEVFTPEDHLIHMINWKDFLELSVSHGVFLLVFPHIKNWIPKNEKIKFVAVNLAQHEKNKKLLSEIISVWEVARKNKIELYYSKGVVLSKLIYDDFYSRQSGDIDVFIKQDNVQLMHEILTSLGYMHVCGKHHADTVDFFTDDYERLNSPILKKSNHHEYFGYYKKIGENQYISLELQRYIHKSITKDIYSFFESCISIQTGNNSILTFDIMHTLLLLFENAYSDSEWYWTKPILKNYADICMFIIKYDDCINWVELKGLSEKYGIKHQLYIIMKYINSLFKNFIPDNIISLFNFNRSNLLILDWDRSIHERLFLDIDHNEEIAILVRKYCYSYKNKLYHNPLILENNSDYNQLTYGLIDLITDNQEISFKYKPLYGNGKLSFCILLEESTLEILDQYILELVLLEYNGIDRRILVKKRECILTITDEVNNLVEDIRINQLPDVNGYKMIEVNVPLIDICFETKDDIKKLVYHVGVIHRKYNNAIEYDITATHRAEEFYFNAPIIGLASY